MLDHILSDAAGAAAWAKVSGNRGAPGADRIPIAELGPIFPQVWRRLREQILAARYHPQPLRRVEIPKPDGRMRKLGIPSVLDRTVQQALAASLAPLWEPTFSVSSFAYRPGRGAREAVAHLLGTIDPAADPWLLHLDIEEFFDSVPHEVALSLLRKRVADERVLELVRRTLGCGVFAGGAVRETEAGIPQGSPLSPLLANIVLDNLDRWMEARGVPFARYADDCAAVVSGEASGVTLRREIGHALRPLGLALNTRKTRLTPWAEGEFLGFRFFANKVGSPAAKASEGALEACAGRASAMIAESPADPGECAAQLAEFLRSWLAYFFTPGGAGDLGRLLSGIASQFRAAFPDSDHAALSPQRLLRAAAAAGPETRRNPAVGYGGQISATSQPKPKNPDSAMLWKSTLRCWAAQLARGGFIRFELDLKRGRRSLLPRFGGVHLCIGRHRIRLKL